MPQRNQDDRSKKIVFVSNCLLNANNNAGQVWHRPDPDALPRGAPHGEPAVVALPQPV